MNTTLILCAGSQQRFESRIPKQLMLFHNKPLLYRTIQQVKSRNQDPYIITRNDKIMQFCNLHNVNIFNPSNNSKCVLTLLSTKKLWTNRVIVLLGDVYYNSKCLDLTYTSQKDIEFFGNGVEIFSISFKPSEKILHSLNIASQHPVGKLWHFYRAHFDIPLDQHQRDTSNGYCLPSDKTNDIDTFEEYIQLKREVEF